MATKKKLFTILFASLVATNCTGFNGAFKETTSFAEANTIVYLRVSDGSTVAGKSIDLNRDGIADGLDLNGDGIPEMPYTWIIPGQLASTDVNGDGIADYYLNQGLNGEMTLYTQATGGTPVTLVKDANGKLIGFDVNGDGVADNTILSQIFTDATPPTSTANLTGGNYNAAQSATLTCTDNVVCDSISYTLDGSTPNFTGNGTVLIGNSGSFNITESSVLNWLARDRNGNLQTVMGSETFSILGSNVALPPVYSPTAGYYSSPQNISLSTTTPGATICYTTNTSEPTCDTSGTCTNGTAYATTIPVSSELGLKAAACKSGFSASPVVVGIYIIDSTAPANASAFSATPGNMQVSLSWAKPTDTDLAGVKILRKTGGYPANATDGTSVYTALGTAYTDTALTNGTQYYYKAFAYDSAGNFATGVQATATPN